MTETMSKKRFWIATSLVNLSIVALFGFTLRSKILFPLHFINYDYIIDAHSHFAFGGWITIAFLNLFTYTLLPPGCQQRKWYHWMKWGILITSFGMLLSFPFEGYGFISISLSTLFIFFSYGYSACFIKDMLSVKQKAPGSFLALGAIICLVISSIGPFTLAYLLASHNSNAILYKDSIYFYLHFQYNGFFTLSVFALLFNAAYNNSDSHPMPKVAKSFAWLLLGSIIPSLFLSLLWHSNYTIIRVLAIIGMVLNLGTLFFFFRLGLSFPLNRIYASSLAKILCFLALLSFAIKLILQTGTIFPGLGNAVFGLRPIIIGFLHLVFLGLATFYILSNYIMTGAFNIQNRFVRLSILVFATSVIFQETILLIQGVGLLLGIANSIYNWLLWFAAIGLFSGAFLMVISTVVQKNKLGSNV
jgi:hypothetical protein